MVHRKRFILVIPVVLATTFIVFKTSGTSRKPAAEASIYIPVGGLRVSPGGSAGQAAGAYSPQQSLNTQSASKAPAQGETQQAAGIE